MHFWNVFAHLLQKEVPLDVLMAWWFQSFNAVDVPTLPSRPKKMNFPAHAALEHDDEISEKPHRAGYGARANGS